MSSRNIVLTAHQTDCADGLISSAHDQNAIAALREAARIGIADIEAGRFVTFWQQRWKQCAAMRSVCACWARTCMMRMGVTCASVAKLILIRLIRKSKTAMPSA